jgi:hypothetical protein
MSIPLEIKLFGIIGLIIASFLGGYHLSDLRWTAKENRIAAETALHLQKVEARNVTLQAKLDDALNNVKTVTVTIIKRIPYVVNHYIEKPGQPVKERRTYQLTWGSVRLWNAALGLSVPGTPAGASDADPEALTLSPISLEDAFRNHAENASICRQAIIGYNGWREWFRNVKEKQK